MAESRSVLDALLTLYFENIDISSLTPTEFARKYFDVRDEFCNALRTIKTERVQKNLE